MNIIAEKKIEALAQFIKNGGIDDLTTEQSVDFIIEGIKDCVSSISLEDSK